MREASYIWAPPIYRRLVSNDKKEVDMVEKCLLNIRSTLLPPPLILFKVVVVDMKENLLNSMKGLVYGGMKLRALQAWGFYIRLIGNCAVMTCNLFDEMLKIPRQTFSDSDSQVQIAAQVAWEGLIDALIQHEKTSKSNCSEDFTDEITRIINLILKPVFGILKSKCDSTVHLQCLNTWSYLLQKVNISVYSLTVINTHCFPIFELVFKLAPDIQIIPLWNFCFDILEDENSTGGQWISWDIGRTYFFLKMVCVMISHTLTENLESDIKNLAHNAALRIFRLVLKGIQNIFKNSSTRNKGLKSCLNATMTFVKKICKDTPQFSLQFLESAIEELEDTVLESSQSTQYKLSLNLTNSDSFGSVSEFSDDTDGVKLIDNVAVLFFGVLYKSPETKFIEHGTFEKFKLLTYSYDPEELLNTGIRLLRTNSSFNGLNIWKENKIDIELVVQVWTSLYKTVLRASIKYSSRSFPEDLFRMLTEILDKSTDNFNAGVNRFVFLSEIILTYVLLSKDGKIEIDNRFRFASRFMTLTLTNPTINSRFSLTFGRIVRSLRQKEHFFSFFENFSSPLLDWLSCKRKKVMINFTELNILWIEILRSVEANMRMSDFDSSFLDVQSNLLSKTLNHASLTISRPTIDFWNATYGDRVEVEMFDYPQFLLPVLKSLLRAQKILRPKLLPDEEIFCNKRKFNCIII